MILYNSIVDSAKEELIHDPKYSSLDETDKRKIRDIKVEIVCMNDDIDLTKHKILKCMFYILSLYGYDTGYGAKRRNDLSVELIIGQDRAGGFNFIGKTLSEFNPPIHFNEIPLPRPEGAMSATKIRNMALDGNEAEFLEIYQSIGVNRDDAKSMYEQIRKNIDHPAATSSKNTMEYGGRIRKSKRTNKTKKSKKTKKTKRTNKKRRSIRSK